MLEIIKSDTYKSLNVIIYALSAKADTHHVSFPSMEGCIPVPYGRNPDGTERSPWQCAMDRIMSQRVWFVNEMPSQANLRRAEILNDLWCYMRRNRDEETEQWDVHFMYVPEKRFLESITYTISMGFITSIEVIRK